MMLHDARGQLQCDRLAVTSSLTFRSGFHLPPARFAPIQQVDDEIRDVLGSFQVI